MCNNNYCTDKVWIGQPDVNERLLSREAPASITLAVVLSVRHHTVGVQSVLLTTGSTYDKRAVENKDASVAFQCESGQRRLREGAVI